MKSSNILLGVNIDHICTIRQARGTHYPDPVQAALLAEQAGADGITAHLREDRRHIQDNDLFLLKAKLKTRLNMEMAVTDEMIGIALKVLPFACCLVPEKREELTTEGGLEIAANITRMKTACSTLGNAGIEVSLFIDPDKTQIEAAVEVGAPIIELHTGCYADATTAEQKDHELKRIITAAHYAHSLGLQVNAGHGLNLDNVTEICAIPEIVELNIGHSIIAHALFVGLGPAVSELKSVMIQARLATLIV